ncbi:hypothetical protein ABZV31_36950 [Streptomyces sp. NPDC005202]|uniref:hypothetical protein n=1 Tax=Streptomyces sp. NPDC005202 TaxID=3157021 RepID=UPI0033AD79E1
MLTRPENTVASIAKLLGVSRNTIYKYVPELMGGRTALAEATATPVLPRPAQPTESRGMSASLRGRTPVALLMDLSDRRGGRERRSPGRRTCDRRAGPSSR